MMFKPLFLTFLFLLLSGCDDLTGAKTLDESKDPNSSNIGGIDTIELDGQRYRLSGTASNGGDSAHHYQAKFLLPSEEELSFIFFATRNLESGIEITFRREGKKIFMAVKANGLGHEIRMKSLEDEFPESKALNLEFDIHNDHADIHTLVWKRNGPRGDRFGCTKDSDFVDEDVLACLYNSEDFALDVWLGVGRASGAFWGIRGDAKLLKEVSGPSRALSDA